MRPPKKAVTADETAEIQFQSDATSFFDVQRSSFKKPCRDNSNLRMPTKQVNADGGNPEVFYSRPGGLMVYV
jgi:hypothetical protein